MGCEFVDCIHLMRGKMQCLYCSCEHGHEHSGVMKGGESVVHLRECELLNKGFAPRVLLLPMKRFPDSTDGIEAVVNLWCRHAVNPAAPDMTLHVNSHFVFVNLPAWSLCRPLRLAWRCRHLLRGP